MFSATEGAVHLANARSRDENYNRGKIFFGRRYERAGALFPSGPSASLARSCCVRSEVLFTWLMRDREMKTTIAGRFSLVGATSGPARCFRLARPHHWLGVVVSTRPDRKSVV